jgi:serine/threonine protein kinase
VSEEISGNGLDVTLREFASGQKLFNRYRLLKTLGRGGMGIVWLARDEELERDVALKFLPDLIIRDRSVLSDLKRETRRSLELTHKNIVRIYDFVHDQTSGCISMEYVDGDTLSNLRADKPHKIFEADELKDWVSQLCDALDYAHNHARIVHRDLKPANLMVNQRGDLKVADFGIARSLSDSVSKLTMDHGKSGTLVYMSPQQLEGERGTHLDDVYSLGASLYELLTSKPPFYSGNVDRQIREKIPPSMTQRRKELEIESEPIDAAWEEVVRACLAKNPEKRPQSVSDIAKRLEVPSPGTRRAARADAKKSRKLVPVLGTAGLLLLAVAGILYFEFYRPMQNRQLRFASPAAPQPPRTEATTTPLAAASPAAKPVQTEAATSPVAAISPFSSAAPEVADKLQATRVEAPKLSSLSPAPSQFAARSVETPSAPAGPKVTANAIYEGTIHVKNENSTNVPLAITIGSDLKSGTMTQSGRHGDVMVKFTGIWDENSLHAVTDEVVSAPKEIKWSPESFTLRFAEDGKTASYECFAGGKTYIADLSAESAPVVKTAPMYKGTIRAAGDNRSGIPLTIKLDANRKSGTMTQTAKSGDVIVKFDGVWEGTDLHAVTDEVVSKPSNIQWQPESFTLRFDNDGKNGSYECKANGKTYAASLTAP